MKESLSTKILAAGFVLAMAFTFSCSDSGGGSKDDNSGGNGDHKCNGETYDPEIAFCFEDEFWHKCNGETYNPETQVCIGGKLLSYCDNGSTYNPATEFCNNNNGSVMFKCGGETYNPETQFCFENEVWDQCNGSTYSPDASVCIENELWRYCNGEIYNTETHICQGSGLWGRCDGTLYPYPEEYFCSGNEVWRKCNGETYNPETKFCSRNEVWDKCGGEEYNPETQDCNGDEIWHKCGDENKTYNPETKFCSEDEIYDKCGGEEYYLYWEYCSNGTKKTYGSYRTVEIGTQIWMSENWEYYSSVCYNNNCADYGPLYDWATAMDLPSKCNNTNSNLDIECKINTPHKGICPWGFHIPTDSEWITLTNFVAPNSGIKLKLTTGWPYNGNGTNNYGFSALPSGIITANGEFGPEGYGYWWTASERNATEAYSRYMAYNSNLVSSANGNKLTSISVRCVQD